MVSEKGLTARRCIAVGLLCLVAGPPDAALAGRLDSQSGDVARRTPPPVSVPREAAQPARQAPPPGSVVAAPPIESPEYYDYKPEALAPVDFSRLKPAPRPAGGEPG